MNIFEALRLSHDTQRTLAVRISETRGDDPERASLYRDFKRELAAHAAAEERFFYLPLIQNDSSIGQARHGMAEHHEMDELVEELAKLELPTAAWLAKFGELRHKVFHHLEDEEHAIFQLAGKVLGEKDKLALAVQYEEAFANWRLSEVPISSAESE